MSSQQPNQYTTQYVSVPRQHQGQTTTHFTYQHQGGSATLNTWLSQDESVSPYHNIGAYRPVTGSGSGANAWGAAPGSNGATRGSGQGRRN
ncbi:hypothetical protein GCG54_00001126 [Colletotrichum gloeosporioides]|uniref:Uncharacterized protein n=1 Tax=Colletotrichum gloeosporioides TaxID=474922 RepID=A0A8H4FFN5_COLGL|nr:uncharacterized protein GCG54_00001126 [Colletotrichum gloeosporioides]KAF3800016.1 hypothetical protein GCG54_00001126 [Colletotrichum gloeosporioides]